MNTVCIHWKMSIFRGLVYIFLWRLATFMTRGYNRGLRNRGYCAWIVEPAFTGGQRSLWSTWRANARMLDEDQCQYCSLGAV